MKLENLHNKTVLLLGKSRAFSTQEFASQLKYHKIRLVDTYEDDVVVVIEGKMMTPYEQNESARLYEEVKVDFINIDLFERELAVHLDEDTLLMSLKLSGDTARGKGFIQNSAISDKLFFKLLKLYRWGGEDFFANDDNRDVTAAIISRFYTNIEQNHNVQYATSGLMHLIVQTHDEKVIELVSSLEPIQKSIQNRDKDINFAIVTAIATNHFTPRNILESFVAKANPYVKTLVAMRGDCDKTMQEKLFDSNEIEVLRALSYNKNLDRGLALKLIENESLAHNIARYIILDNEIYTLLKVQYAASLAKNETLTHFMQQNLIELDDENVKIALATNIYIDENIVNELVSVGSQEVHYAIYENENTSSETLEEAYDNVLNHPSLAYNKNTPARILILLSESENIHVLEGLAQNPSTPVEILYQLQLDRRLERFVKANPTFGEYIKTENIGWRV